MFNITGIIDEIIGKPEWMRSSSLLADCLLLLIGLGALLWLAVIPYFIHYAKKKAREAEGKTVDVMKKGEVAEGKPRRKQVGPYFEDEEQDTSETKFSGDDDPQNNEDSKQVEEKRIIETKVVVDTDHRDVSKIQKEYEAWKRVYAHRKLSPEDCFPLKKETFSIKIEWRPSEFFSRVLEKACEQEWSGDTSSTDALLVSAYTLQGYLSKESGCSGLMANKIVKLIGAFIIECEEYIADPGASIQDSFIHVEEKGSPKAYDNTSQSYHSLREVLNKGFSTTITMRKIETDLVYSDKVLDTPMKIPECLALILTCPDSRPAQSLG